MAVAAPKKTYHHGDLRDALLGAALAILEEGGDPSVLTLRETARRAGVSAMAPYRHFADKDALLAGVVTIGFERFAAVLRTADADADRVEALVAQGVAYVAFAEANPALFRLMFGAAAPPRCEGLAKVGESAFAILADRVATLVPQTLVADWTLACWSLAHGLALLALDGRLMPGEPAPILAGRLLRLIAVKV